MTMLIRLLRRLGRPRPAVSASRVLVVRVRRASLAPRPMGFREADWEEWYRRLECSLGHEYRIAREHVAMFHGLDHTVGLMARVSNREPYRLRELLSGRVIDREELAFRAADSRWHLDTPN